MNSKHSWVIFKSNYAFASWQLLGKYDLLISAAISGGQATDLRSSHETQVATHCLNQAACTCPNRLASCIIDAPAAPSRQIHLFWALLCHSFIVPCLGDLGPKNIWGGEGCSLVNTGLV